MTAIAAREIIATPPTTPPTMAPVFELLFDVGEDPEVGFTVEEDSPEGDDVAPLRVPVAETVAPEGPSNTPGACSGVSSRGCETLVVRE